MLRLALKESKSIFTLNGTIKASVRCLRLSWKIIFKINSLNAFLKGNGTKVGCDCWPFLNILMFIVLLQPFHLSPESADNIRCAVGFWFK